LLKSEMAAYLEASCSSTNFFLLKIDSLDFGLAQTGVLWPQCKGRWRVELEAIVRHNGWMSAGSSWGRNDLNFEEIAL
jgi:hypothetical protein